MEKFLRQYEILFTKAKEDLTVAKYLLDGFHNHNLELNLEIIFFHLQQCAEKLIKAFLDFNKIKFPHTHDLKELISLMEDHQINFINDVKPFILLTQYAVEGRYAVIHDDLEDADEYIEILEKLLLFVESKLKS